MGIVYTEITLKNAGDVIVARRSNEKETNIRQTTVQAVVDTGAATLVINEEVREELGLEVQDTYEAELADGSKQVYLYSEPVQIHWKNRKTIQQAVVVPSASQILLGAIPLEAMDLIVNPAKLELTGAHGDEILLRV